MANLQKEIWKDIIGYEGYYQVSNIGRVRRLKTLIKSSKGGYQTHQGGILNPTQEKIGYRALTLYDAGRNKRFRIHTLVAMAFIDNPNGYKEINHIDGVKNNNRVENLEWCSRSHNNAHKYNILHQAPTVSYKLINDPLRSRKVRQLDLSGNFIKEWPSMAQIKRELGIHKNSIFCCLSGKYAQSHGFKWEGV